MIYGYARISTPSQSISRQIRNLRNYDPEIVIIEEAYSGTTQVRPRWQRLLRSIEPGDTIIFDSVSRMSRNAEEGYREWLNLYEKGVNLVFLKEPYINTQTFSDAIKTQIPLIGDAVDMILDGVNKYLQEVAKGQIRIAFDQAQKEVDDLRQRTKEGMETARLAGKHIGRPRGSTRESTRAKEIKQIIRTHLKDFGGTLSTEECRRVAGVAHGTFYRYLRAVKEEDKHMQGD